MRLRCYFCGKSVSTEVDDETIVRAILVCPECIEAGKMVIPEGAVADTPASVARKIDRALDVAHEFRKITGKPSD